MANKKRQETINKRNRERAIGEAAGSGEPTPLEAIEPLASPADVG
jgi:hypothetical protein